MRVITDGVLLQAIPIRQALLRLAKVALGAGDERFDDIDGGWKPPSPESTCLRYFSALEARHAVIGSNRESQHITMARIALDRGAPMGERGAAAYAFFKFARKHNITAEAIVSITHPPEASVSAEEFLHQAQRQHAERQTAAEQEQMPTAKRSPNPVMKSYFSHIFEGAWQGATATFWFIVWAVIALVVASHRRDGIAEGGVFGAVCIVCLVTIVAAIIGALNGFSNAFSERKKEREEADFQKRWKAANC